MQRPDPPAARRSWRDDHQRDDGSYDAETWGEVDANGELVAPDPPAAIQRGQTIHAWFDVTYYDGLWTFAQGCKTGEWPVEWCGQELPKVEATHA